MQNYTEFALTITAYDLAIVDNSLNARDSEELLKLLNILEITPSNVSLIEKYESFNDGKLCEHWGHGKLLGHYGQGNVIVLQSDIDARTFVSIDMFLDLTDQMCSVEFGVSCPSDRAKEIERLLRKIHQGSEINGTFRSGMLGLSRELQPNNFPRIPKRISYRYDIPVFQDIEIYRYGILQAV